jgi:hypothetical protein
MQCLVFGVAQGFRAQQRKLVLSSFQASPTATCGLRRSLVCPSPVLFKDKPSGVTKGVVNRKSKFLKLDDKGNPLQERRERSDVEKKQLEEARVSRDQKKKEIRAKQLEIQKKRDEAAAAKESKAKKSKNEDD